MTKRERSNFPGGNKFSYVQCAKWNNLRGRGEYLNREIKRHTGKSSEMIIKALDHIFNGDVDMSSLRMKSNLVNTLLL